MGLGLGTSGGRFVVAIVQNIIKGKLRRLLSHRRWLEGDLRPTVMISKGALKNINMAIMGLVQTRLVVCIATQV